DGATWMMREATGPTSRPVISMTLDPQSGHAVMLAGLPPGGEQIGLWQWTGVTWGLLPGTPPQSTSGSLFYDGRLVFLGFSGDSLAGARMEVWTWDSATWVARDASGPTLRSVPGMGFD